MKCQIILTATRSRGGSIDSVRSFKPSYEIFRINQKYEHNEKIQSDSNQSIALQLVSKIQTEINA
jgi:hypothetical protein